MKIPCVVVVVLSLGLIAGCGRNDPTVAAAPAAAPGPKSFALTANDTMKYNLTRLEVSAGDEVQLTLANTGTMPKASMAHNWILLKSDRDPVAFTNAAVTHKADDYFPTELAGEVLVHTRLLGPRERDTVKFKAPAGPGEYIYLCTFPGHYVSGMHGVLVVH